MVDILLATYNGEVYLKEMLDSLMNQTMQEFHIYIRDDGSTDRTLVIAEGFQQTYPEKITLIQDELNVGNACGNFLELLSHSTQEYIMFADQDDVWEPNKIELEVNEIHKYKDTPVLLHTDLCVVDENLKTVAPSLMELQRLEPNYITLNRLIAQNNVTGCTVVMNRALVKLFRNASGILMHDWWFALIAAAFGKVVFVDQKTVQYRQHTENEVGAKDVKSASYFRQKISNTGGIRDSILKTYSQASSFLETYQDILSDDQKEMLTVFTELQDKSKCSRMRLLSKYKLYKSGLYRKVGQIIYG